MHCVGASVFPPQRGLCACLAGACSPEGTCSSQGLPQTLDDQPGAAYAPQAYAPAAPQPLPPAPAPGAGSQWYGPNTGAPAPAPKDDFSAWHTPTRLFELPAEGPAAPWRHGGAAAALAALAAVAGLALAVRLAPRAAATTAGGSEYEEVLTPSDTDPEGAAASAMPR